MLQPLTGAAVREVGGPPLIPPAGSRVEMRPSIGSIPFNQQSLAAGRRISVETEILHELAVILVDRYGHVNGPMIIAFVQLASKGFQSLFIDRLSLFHMGSRRRWIASGRFTNLGPGWVRRHNISLSTSFRREPERALRQSE